MEAQNIATMAPDGARHVQRNGRRRDRRHGKSHGKFSYVTYGRRRLDTIFKGFFAPTRNTGFVFSSP